MVSIGSKGATTDLLTQNAPDTDEHKLQEEETRNTCVGVNLGTDTLNWTLT